MFQQRLQTALENMKATARIIEDGNAARQRIVDRVNDDWSEIIRGTNLVHDDRFDTLNEVPSYTLKDLVDKMNDHEGYKRWKIIPLKDINHP